MGSEIPNIDITHYKELEQLFDDGDFSEMIIVARKFLHNSSNNPYLLRRLAFGYFKENNMSQAKRYIEMAWDLCPNDGLVMWDYAQYLWNISNESQAIKIMKRLSFSDADELLLKTHSSFIRLKKSSMTKLINDSRFILGQWYQNIDEEISSVWFNEYINNRRLGIRSYFKLKEATDAIETNSNIKIIEDLWGSGDICVKKKLEKILDKEISKNPEDDWFLGRLAGLSLEFGDYDKAIVAIKRALNIYPNDSVNLWRYAQILVGLEKYQESLLVLKKLLEKSERQIAQTCSNNSLWFAKALKNDCRCLKGICYQQLGKKSLAIRWLQSHLDNRKRGLRSNYSRTDIVNKIKQIIE